MKIASVAEVKAKLSAYLKASAEELVVITRNGKAVGVLLPVEDDDELERLVLAYSKQFRTVLTQARAEMVAGRGITHADFWAMLDQGDPTPPDPNTG